MMKYPQQMTVRQASFMFGVSDGLVSRWVRKHGGLTPVAYNGAWPLYDRKDLVKWAKKLGKVPADFDPMKEDAAA